MTSLKGNKSEMDIDVTDIINNNYLEPKLSLFNRHSEQLSDNERIISSSYQTSAGKRARQKSNTKHDETITNSMADNATGQSKYYLRSKCPHGCCQANKNQLLKHRHYIDHQQNKRK